MSASLGGIRQEGLIDIKQKYVLRRLVFVNSATHGYSEIELDKHMALFGRNNRGKTASLAALKLALFPETSFTRCAAKFKFTGKDGDYSKEHSYEFYFPSQRSYIITEVENPDGVYSMVLYKDKPEWSYGRFFVPCPYEDLRRLFWDVGAVDGEGGFPDDLSPKAVRSALKEMGAVQSSDAKEIAEYLFSGHRGDRNQSRYCLFPLSDGSSKEAVEAFRNLYQLAFDIGQTDKRSLPRAVATIIEMQRGRKEERLSANIDDILEAHSQLEAQKTKLIRLKNSANDWASLDADYRSYSTQKTQLANEIASMSLRLELDQQSLQESMESIVDRVERAVLETKSAAQQARAVSDRRVEVRTNLNAARTRSDTNGKKYRHALGVIGQYPGMDADAVRDILKSVLEENQERVAAYASDESIRQHYSESVNRRSDYIRRCEQLRGHLADNKPSVLEAMPEAAADALWSIHEAFGGVPDTIEEAPRQAAESFASHITVESSLVKYCGHVLHGVEPREYDKHQQRERWEEELRRKEADISALNLEINDLKSDLTDTKSKEHTIRTLRKECEETTRDIDLLGAINILKSEYEQSSADAARFEQELEIIDNEYEQCDAALDEAKHAEMLVKGEEQLLRPDLANATTWLERIESKRRRLPAAPANEAEPWDAHRIAEADIRSIEDRVDTLLETRQSIYGQLKNLMLKAFPERDGAFDVAIEEDHLSRTIDEIELVFQALPNDLVRHENEVQTHNHTVDNQLQELREAQAIVQRFIRSLNDELNRHKISNLEAIRLREVMNPRFEQLMSDLGRYDLYGDNSLMSPEFYDRLNTFCKEFFDGKKRALNLEMLIDSIHYEYKHPGDEKYDRKSQSGGTTSTTTALILAVLLDQISPSHVEARIPIVVDEIASLDGSNVSTTIDTVAAHGFTVFCASPEPEPAVMSAIGRWTTLGRFHVGKPLVDKCHTLLLPELVHQCGTIEGA